MPSLPARDVDRTFRGKMEAEVKDGDHCRYVWRFEGRAVLATELSTPFRGNLSPGLVAHIARRQLHLASGAADLADLVRCTKSREWWDEHIEREAHGGQRRGR